MIYNIAIDGPAGAGKSTIAKRLARELFFIYVDTGAMYRAMALYLIKRGTDPSDPEQIAEVCQEPEITIRYQEGEQIVLLNGENVNDRLRTEEVGNMASVSSANPAVRRKLLELQRELAGKQSVIMDGRDIGTTILPNADVKIYLTASSRCRAERRYLELKEKGVDCDFREIKQDIEERDRRDMNREISPLKKAEDAVLLDSSEMSIEEVVNAILQICHDKMIK